MEIKDKNDLKIIELKGENFKMIKAIVIRPDDNLVLLTGKNAQGKSSAIDLIIAMLCKDRKWIPQPIRKGQTHADGRLDLGEFIVYCMDRERQISKSNKQRGFGLSFTTGNVRRFCWEIRFRYW